MSHSSPQLDKKVPRAEPEEDIDVLMPGAEGALLENQTSSTTKIADASELNEDSGRITHMAKSLAEEKMTDLKQVVQILEAFKLQEDSDEFINPIPDASTFDCLEIGEGSKIHDEVDKWTSDQVTVKDLKENLSSDCQDILQQPEIPPLLDKELVTTLVEVAGDKVTKGGNSSQLSYSESVKTTPAAEVSQHSPSAENYKNDVCSPKFTDKSQEKEEDTKVVPSYSAPLPVVPSDKQQNELFSQSRCEQALRGSNQEATQQVCSQSNPPLSTVAMELSNQGGAGSQDSVCVALTGRHNRVVERREGKSEQTGGEEGQKDGVLEREKVTRKQDSEGLYKPAETENYLVSSRDIRMESDSSDDSQSDSGVSTDLSPCNTLEGNANISAARLKETPIEREIRRSIEREHSLRRSRGLSSPPTEPEYVEIPLRMSVLSPPIISRSEKYKGKDRQYAGRKMQLEIHEDVQREQDLVKLGKIPGFYDKGTTRELKDRKEIFEAFQKPDNSSLTIAKGKASSNSDILNATISSNTAGSISIYSSEPVSSIPQDQGFPDTCQDVMQEKHFASPPPQIVYQHKPDPDSITEVDFVNPDASSRGGEQEQRAAGVESSPRANPFFKLRSSNTVLRVEQDIREAQDREQELYRQRISLYGKESAKEGGGGGPEDGKEKKSFTLSPLKPSTEG